MVSRCRGVAGCLGLYQVDESIQCHLHCGGQSEVRPRASWQPWLGCTDAWCCGCFLSCCVLGIPGIWSWRAWPPMSADSLHCLQQLFFPNTKTNNVWCDMISKYSFLVFSVKELIDLSTTFWVKKYLFTKFDWWFQIYAMTLRLSAMFEDQIKEITSHWKSACRTKQLPKQSGRYARLNEVREMGNCKNCEVSCFTLCERLGIEM